MERFENILFDLDGTISDSYEGITKSVVYALQKMGIAPPRDRNDLRVFIGPPLRESFARYYALDRTQTERAVMLYRENYNAGGMLDCKPYDGIIDAIKLLHKNGKRIILATSKPENAAVKIIEHFGLTDHFYFIAGATSDSSRVEKADVIEYALASTNVDRARSVMVGDRLHDINGAKATGLKSIGVLYGYGNERELVDAGADYLAKTPTDIVRISIGR